MPSCDVTRHGGNQPFGVAILLSLILTSCSGGLEPRTQDAYAPVFARASDKTAVGQSLKGDYDWAASSATLAEAETRWTEFLRRHRPADGEYEDAFAAMHVRAAELELLRVEYLLGRAAEGDTLLRRIDPLDVDYDDPP